MSFLDRIYSFGRELYQEKNNLHFIWIILLYIFVWLTNWSIDQLTDRSIDRSVGRSVGRSIDWLVDWYFPVFIQAALDQLTNLGHAAVCPDCETEVTPEPTKKELEEMTHEGRLRILKAEKVRVTPIAKDQCGKGHKSYKHITATIYICTGGWMEA